MQDSIKGSEHTQRREDILVLTDKEAGNVLHDLHANITTKEADSVLHDLHDNITTKEAGNALHDLHANITTKEAGNVLHDLHDHIPVLPTKDADNVLYDNIPVLKTRVVGKVCHDRISTFTSKETAEAPRNRRHHIPTFTTKEAAEAWYNARARDVHAPPHLYQTLIGWEDVEKILLPHMARLGVTTSVSSPSSGKEAKTVRAASNAEAHVAAIFESAPVYKHLAWNPDAVLNTLRYLYVHCRCGIFVAIRRGVVAAFFPFVNPRYTNTWGHKVQFPRGMTLEEYISEKAALLRRAPEDVLPVARWWMNSGIVCNVMPPTYWGDAYLAALRDMLDATCERHDVPDVDFFVNKRDHPVLTREYGREPYAAQTGDTANAREVYSTYAPVLSFYTGTDMADLPMPTTEDWCAATGKSFPGSPYATPGLEGTRAPATLSEFMKREAKAVFRGSATGTGTSSATNARLKLVEVACPDLVDAAVTGYNYTRDKIMASTADAVHVDFRRPSAKDPAPAAFMPLAEQFLRFRYVIYVDGHAAASRYGTLMLSGCVILKTASRLARVSGHLWMFPDLVGGMVAGSSDIHVPDNADHMIIDAEFGNLSDTIRFLNANAEVAHKIAENAKRRAPSVENITRYWADVLWETAARFCSKAVDLGGVKPWYSFLDKKYAGSKFTSTK